MPRSPETRAKAAEARRQWWASRTEEEKAAYREKMRRAKRKAWKKLSGEDQERIRSNFAAARQRRPRASVRVPCDHCGDTILRAPCLLRRLAHAFCSRSCSAAFRSEQARGKAENRAKCLRCGKEFYRPAGRAKWNKGVHYCSRACANLGRVGEGHHNWKGGRTVRDDGYIDVTASIVPEQFRPMARVDGRILEHRLKMAMHLGRLLEAHEIVHHKNGVRNDNRIDNLEMHGAHEHDGITQSENKKIRQLEKDLKRLQAELDRLRGEAIDGEADQ